MILLSVAETEIIMLPKLKESGRSDRRGQVVIRWIGEERLIGVRSG